MKIAFLGDALDIQYAGIHIYVKEILRAITQLDSPHEWFVLRSQEGGEYKGVQEIISPIRPLPMYQKMRFFTSIPQKMRQHKMDVVIEPAHFGPFNLPKSTKRVTVIHDITPVLFPEYHPRASSFFHKLLLPIITKNADAIITNSQHTQKDLMEHYPKAKDKSSVVYLGKEAQFQPTQDASILKKYGIQQPYIFFVGTLEPRKNLSVLVKAYEAFRQTSNQNIQLVLAGKKGWKIEDLLSTIEASSYKDDIVLTNYVERSELPTLYSMAEVFVYPSLYEGFGLPVLEAMACGTAVITSNVSSLPEVGGEAALYFDPKDINELSAKMKELLNNKSILKEREQLCLKQAAQFSWKKAAQETLNIIENL